MAKESKSSVFQIIGISLIVLSFFIPMLFIGLFAVSTIICGIIALARREKYWGFSLLVLIGGFAIWLLPGINQAMDEISEEEVINKMNIVDWTWEDEGRYTYVRGRVKNNSTETVTYFEVTANYLDSDGNILDSDYTNSGIDLLPGASKEFEIMHEDNPSYKKVSVRVNEVNIK